MRDTSFRSSLLKFVRRRPFKSFMVELVSGDRIVVEHPEAVALGGASAVYISPEGEYAMFDSSTVSQLTDVTENGSKSPRRRSSH